MRRSVYDWQANTVTVVTGMRAGIAIGGDFTASYSFYFTHGVAANRPGCFVAQHCGQVCPVSARARWAGWLGETAASSLAV
mmetsp:Transcript_281/g.751  ORF Transcript_281/g.751 Transcript_281/m.751 type:complete len:81 (-) Transcript_281:710-952(-)